MSNYLTRKDYCKLWKKNGEERFSKEAYKLIFEVINFGYQSNEPLFLDAIDFHNKFCLYIKANFVPFWGYQMLEMIGISSNADLSRCIRHLSDAELLDPYLSQGIANETEIEELEQALKFDKDIFEGQYVNFVALPKLPRRPEKDSMRS